MESPCFENSGNCSTQLRANCRDSAGNLTPGTNCPYAPSGRSGYSLDISNNGFCSNSSTRYCWRKSIACTTGGGEAQACISASPGGGF